MAKYSVGYTAGVYDLFHVGHLNILREAKGLCDTLIVGVSTDELAIKKGKEIIIPFKERIEIISSIRYVDITIPQTTFNKYEIWEKIKFDVLIVGDDWFGNEKWHEYGVQLGEVHVPIIYFPYTSKISSTNLRKKIK